MNTRNSYEKIRSDMVLFSETAYLMHSTSYLKPQNVHKHPLECFLYKKTWLAHDNSSQTSFSNSINHVQILTMHWNNFVKALTTTAVGR